MWKEFFTFSKRERATIVALILLVLMVQLALWTEEYWVGFLPEKTVQHYEQKKALEAYRDSMMEHPRSFRAQDRAFSRGKKEESVRLIPFNPNVADSAALKALGLRSYVVKNILNYRRKGGFFRKSADFARIYGLDSATFSLLEPYIRLEANRAEVAVVPRSERVPTSVAETKLDPPQAPPDAPQAAAHVYELNIADTALLQQIKGIGSYTANRIARYRSQLGGFYSMSQLSEIKGLYPETLTRLQSMLQIDPGKIEKLNANKASLEKLKAHPYLSFYQAKVITELRKSRGQLRSIDDLAPFKEFSPEDLDRLKWYLSF